MANPETRPDIPDPKPDQPSRRDRRDYDEFHETLAAPAPARTYRSERDTSRTDYDRVSVLEEIVRYVSVLLGLLLGVRFVISLFTANATGGLTGFLRSTTNWIVAPFQTLFGRPPSGTGGFFDWPTLAALVVVAIITTLLISLLRPREY
jgi:hypothetical protein